MSKIGLYKPSLAARDNHTKMTSTYDVRYALRSHKMFTTILNTVHSLVREHTDSSFDDIDLIVYAIHDNIIVAFLAVAIYPDLKTAHIVFSFTHEDQRRNGINYTLACALIKILKERRLAEIITSLSADSYTIRKRLHFKDLSYKALSMKKLRNLSPFQMEEVKSLVNDRSDDLRSIADKLRDLIFVNPNSVPEFVLETMQRRDWYVMDNGKRLDLPDHSYTTVARVNAVYDNALVHIASMVQQGTKHSATMRPSTW